jgi:hypothetical protein
MPNPHYPSVDESFARLHRAGWSNAETAFGSDHSLVWIVSGSNGENRIEARGKSQTEAWYRTAQQAEAVGMLAPARPTATPGRFTLDG